jgi:hypothetical protein
MCMPKDTHGVRIFSCGCRGCHRVCDRAAKISAILDLRTICSIIPDVDVTGFALDVNGNRFGLEDCTNA